jgi:hypothetical protein
VPSTVSRNVECWRKNYPGCVTFWTDENIGEFAEIGVHDPLIHPVIRADLLRVLVIERYGGWYVDADAVPAGTQLKWYRKPVFGLENERRLLNGLFFSPSNHPFLKTWKSEILRSLDHPDFVDYSVADRTGPGALARALQEYLYLNGCINDGISILPNSLKVDGSLLSRSQREKSLAVHHPLKSWQAPTSNKSKAKKYYENFYLRWVYWGHFGFTREILRVLFNSPKVFVRNIFNISLLFFLSNCHPVRVSELESLLTVKDEEVRDFLRVTQCSRVKAMKLATLSAPTNSELFWYRFRFLKTTYYFRRNYIRVLEVAHDY